LSKRDVTIIVNGVTHAGPVEVRQTLADYVRDELHLTGTHIGCEHGVCGACTVMVNGEATRACLMLAVQAHGSRVQTIEGLSSSDGLSAVQTALRDEHGLQCGFCTPGFVVSIEAMIARGVAPIERDVREHLTGNLCRCTGYQGIVRAALRVLGDAQRDVVVTNPPADSTTNEH